MHIRLRIYIFPPRKYQTHEPPPYHLYFLIITVPYFTLSSKHISNMMHGVIKNVCIMLLTVALLASYFINKRTETKP
jgi:hypothetical protein